MSIELVDQRPSSSASWLTRFSSMCCAGLPLRFGRLTLPHPLPGATAACAGRAVASEYHRSTLFVCHNIVRREESAVPLVRIDVQEGRSPEQLRRLADVVQEVMLEVFDAPDRDRYQIITVHPVGSHHRRGHQSRLRANQ